MECPNCKRNLSAKKPICMYCGASLDGAAPNFDTRITADDNNLIVSEEQTNIALNDFYSTVKSICGKD